MYFMRGKSGLRRKGRAGCALEGSAGGQIRAVVGKGLEHGFSAVRSLLKQDGQGCFQGGEAIIRLAGVTIDAIQESSQVDEQVARINELEVEEFLFARHGVTLRSVLGIPILKNRIIF
jgi:hypothetical protein